MEKLAHVQKIASLFGQTCCNQFLTSRLLASATCGNHNSTSRLQHLVQQQHQKLTPPAIINFTATSSKPSLNVIRKCAPSNQCIFIPDIATEWYKYHRRATKSAIFAKYCEMLRIAGVQPKNTDCQNSSTAAQSTTRFKRISQDFHKLLIEHERKAAVIQKPKPKSPPTMKHKSQNIPIKRRKSKSGISAESKLKTAVGVHAHGYRYKDIIKEVQSNNDDICQNMHEHDATSDGISKDDSKKNYKTKNETCNRKLYATVSAHGYSNYSNITKRQSGGSNKKYNSLGARCPDKLSEQRSYVTAHGYCGYESEPERSNYKSKENKKHTKKGLKFSKQNKESIAPYAHGYHYRNNTEETRDKNCNSKQSNESKSKTRTKHNNVNQTKQYAKKTCKNHISTPSAHGFHNPRPRSETNCQDTDTDNYAKKTCKNSIRTPSAHGFHNPRHRSETNCQDTDTDNYYHSDNEACNSTSNKAVRKKHTRVRATGPPNRRNKGSSSEEYIRETTTSRRKKRKPEKKNLQEIWIKSNATEMRSTDSGLSLKRYHTELYEKPCDETCCSDDQCMATNFADKKSQHSDDSSTDYPFSSNSNVNVNNRTDKEKMNTKKKTEKEKTQFEKRDKNKRQKSGQKDLSYYSLKDDESSENKMKCLKIFPKYKKDRKPKTESASATPSATASASDIETKSDIDAASETDNDIEVESEYKKDIKNSVEYEMEERKKKCYCTNLQLENDKQYYHHLSHRVMDAKSNDKNELPKIKRRKTESDYDSDDCSCDEDEPQKDKNYYHTLSHKKQCHDEIDWKKKSVLKKYEKPSISQYHHNKSHCNNETQPTKTYKKPKQTKKHHRGSDQSLDKQHYHKLSHKKADSQNICMSKQLKRKSGGKITSEGTDSDSTKSSINIPKSWQTSRRPYIAVEKDDKKSCRRKKQKNMCGQRSDVSTSYSNLAKNKKICEKCYDHSRFWKKEKPVNTTKSVKAHGYDDNVIVTIPKYCGVIEPEYILGRDELCPAEKRRRKRN